MDGACVLLLLRRDGRRLDHAVGLQAAAHHRERAVGPRRRFEDDRRGLALDVERSGRGVGGGCGGQGESEGEGPSEELHIGGAATPKVGVKLYGAVVGHFDAEVSQDLLRTLERARLRFHRFFNG